MLISSQHLRSSSSAKKGAGFIPYRFLQKSGKGFTLIELLAVVTIMMVITGTLLVRQQQFNSATLLRSLAYSVALSVRQAQTYGTSVHISGTDTAQFGASAYGIHFDKGSTSFFIYADNNNDGYYSPSGANPDTKIKTFNLSKGYSISNFAALEPNSNTNYDCMSTASPIPIGGGQYANCVVSSIVSMDVLFRRPNPDACIALQDSTGSFPHSACTTSSYYPTAYIQLASQGGSSRSVRIGLTGEIEVGTTGT